MDLPVMPPIDPMLAKSVPQIPAGQRYEPKWDGFRAVIFRDGSAVEIGSRNTRSIARYFPEVVASALAHLPSRCVLDGEIVVPSATTTGLDFEALLQRIHPAASRVEMLARTTPALFVAFDLLALDDDALMSRPLAARRALLEDALARSVGAGTATGEAAAVHLTPQTEDPDLAAQWFERFEGAGLDGVVAKRADGPYLPGKRGWAKIKHDRTADCVVAGYRVHTSGPDAIGSLLLGLHTDEGELASVGVIGAFPMARRRELFAELQPLRTELAGHPWAAALESGTRTPREAETSRWNRGKDLSFVPLRPERVVEVAYDHMEGTRFRHTAQFRRWRPDRDPDSCTFAQLEEPVSFALADVLSAGRPSS
ncbi:ATP-dependent DNA ligase [Pengzhenrongella frigida]|uniref:DNA ligase (ATP) n=1 Tax=Pengzhenrongella frigida TaxID=1259133 RepID=A0A4Q5MX50_9MICO|nr:ATP-dependent DNA ligase [Cellulomonas sp. HLT2-17]RYV50218.1 ATP-dependent DNA ligase [Cellulomonas sp. HLT2-17]